MKDLIERIDLAIHLESSAISPKTSVLIEVAREARAELLAKNAEIARIKSITVEDMVKVYEEASDKAFKDYPVEIGACSLSVDNATQEGIKAIHDLINGESI